MKVLALEAYYGGSHKAFLDGWIAHSRHDWQLNTLPPYKWKWRMRHAAATFATALGEGLPTPPRRYDALFCTDMLNLAEFKGLAAKELRDLPAVLYFHENQLTYPVRHESERDFHYAVTNITSGLAADQVWFNSAWHRDEFLSAAAAFLRKMPDHQLPGAVEAIAGKSQIQYPGVDPFPPRGERRPGPLRILWAARWEHDKNPAAFFAALRVLATQGTDFRASVIGEQFRDSPAEFAAAKLEFAARIDRWGYLPSRAEYVSALLEADVFVSTADHEFFGIAAVEAIAAGAFPVLPQRLAYPELLTATAEVDAYFYDGSVAGLAARLVELAHRLADDSLWPGDPATAAQATAKFLWPSRAAEMDQAMSVLLASRV